MMRLVLTFLAVLALTACNTTVPDDGNATKRMEVSDAIVDANEDGTDSEAAGEDGETPQKEVKVAVINNDNPTISDTQDFGALTERVTIEDDKAILKAQREKFQEIKPTALPSRGNSVNVAEFALQTKHNVGEKKYKRGNPLGNVLTKRNCQKYRLPDDAQAAFLKAGGPNRDARNLDPDGDGFACDWSPETYRKLLKKS